MSTTTTQQGAGRTGVLGNILAIFAFLFIIAIGIWGAVTAFKLAPSMLSLIGSPFSSKTEILIVSPTEAVSAGENFSLIWEYKKAKDAGIFSFTYDCVDDFYFEAPIEEGGVYGPITCAVAYGVPGSETGIRLVPKTERAGAFSVPVTVSYTEDGEVLSAVKKDIAVAVSTPSSEDDAEKTPENTKPTTKTNDTNTSSGSSAKTGAAPRMPADLVARLQSVSTDPYTGYTVVQFEVQNIGGKATGGWQFTADLPTHNGYHYVSPTQASLNSYDGIVFTLSFDQSAGGTLSITVDPSDWVAENNESNNFLSETIGGGYYPSDTSSYTPTYDYGAYYQDPYQVYVPEYSGY